MIYKKKIIGWLLIVIGLAILVTPFTPGSILLLIGLNIVFGDDPRYKNLKERVYNFLAK